MGELERGNLHCVKLCEVLEEEDEEDSGCACAVGVFCGGAGAWGSGGGVEVVGLSTVCVHWRKKPQENN